MDEKKEEIVVDDFALEKIAKELRSQVGSKKKSETPEETKERMKKTLNQRDAALRQIWSYQDETGIPNSSETEANFFKNEINQKD